MFDDRFSPVKTDYTESAAVFPVPQFPGTLP